MLAVPTKGRLPLREKVDVMRGTVPGHTDIDLLDYTRSLADLDGDAVICVSFLSGSRLGPTLRIPALAGGDGVRTGRAATAALAV